MRQPSYLGLVAALALSQVPAGNPPSPKVLLQEVQGLIGKIASRTEKSVVYLAYAQAQARIGDHGGALRSLRLGWSVHQAGPLLPHTASETYDPQTLVDNGDLATLPISYAYEFVVAGDIPDARAAAMSLGESRLADAFRDDLGHRLFPKYPQVVEVVTLTDRQREARVVEKNRIMAGLASIRAEKDAGKRVWDLRDAGESLARVGAKTDALTILQEAAAQAGMLPDMKWRAIYETEIADVLFSADNKKEAGDLVAKADTDARSVPDPKDRLEARFYVEQTKRTMGLPNEYEYILRERDPQATAQQASGTQSGKPPLNSSEPSDLLTLAEQYRAKGDTNAAKQTLRRVKGLGGNDGWWLVLVAELQIRLGDKVPARQNLTVGSRRFVATLHPEPYVDREAVFRLEEVARDQQEVGDKPAALKTLKEGFHRLASGERWATMPQLVLGSGAGGSSTITRDRQSPVLHVGAVALARAGFYSGAISMARTIQDPAQRAVAIAGAIRDGLPIVLK